MTWNCKACGYENPDSIRECGGCERDRKQDMMDAHSQGLHEGLPRDGCPDCEQQGGRRRAA